MPSPNPPAPAAPPPRWLAWLGVLALAGYAVFLAMNSAVVAGGADSSGYLNSARLLAAGQLQTPLRVPPEFGGPGVVDEKHFFPQGLYPFTGNLQLSPTYPSGLPLHFAVAGKIFGWQTGPLLVGLAGALAALWLCYAVARELGLDPWLAVSGVVALGACPIFIMTSTQPLSDTLATTWTLAAIFAALRARQAVRWAVACGAAFAISVLVRPSNLLALPALGIFLGFGWRPLVLAILGGAPGAVWLAYYNHTLYGNAFTTGYPVDADTFAVRYVAPTLVHLARWLALLLPAVFLVLPCFAVARRDSRTRHLLALAVWFGAIAAFYSAYAITQESWSCLRFLLPALPALIFAALLGLDAGSRLLPSHWPACVRASVGLLLIVWSAAISWHWTRKLGILYTKGYEQVYADANEAAKAQIPSAALIVASYLSGALYYYTDFPVLRWDQIKPTDFARYAALAQKAGRPIYAVLQEVEEKDALHERCPGDWTRVGTVKNVGLWRFTSPPAVAGSPK